MPHQPMIVLTANRAISPPIPTATQPLTRHQPVDALRNSLSEQLVPELVTTNLDRPAPTLELATHRH